MERERAFLSRPDRGREPTMGCQSPPGERHINRRGKPRSKNPIHVCCHHRGFVTDTHKTHTYTHTEAKTRDKIKKRRRWKALMTKICYYVVPF